MKLCCVKVNINSPVQPLSELVVHTLFLTETNVMPVIPLHFCLYEFGLTHAFSLLPVLLWRLAPRVFFCALTSLFVLFPTLVSVQLRSPVPFYPLVCIWYVCLLRVCQVFVFNLFSLVACLCFCIRDACPTITAALGIFFFNLVI